MPLVRIQNVWRSFGKSPLLVHALKDVNLDVEAGDFLLITGRSGSGKTTLLNLISGLDSPTQGSITVRDRELARLGDAKLSRYRNAEVGYVFQAFHLETRRTALANVTTPLLFTSLGRKAGIERGMDALEQVGLADRAQQRAGTLSAGQRQRVALARALINDPSIILADEPTANLDAQTAGQIFEMILALVKDHDKTVILVSHDRDLVLPEVRQILVQEGVVSETPAQVRA